MSGGLIFCMGFGFGTWFAWYFWLRHSKPTPKIDITIDPETLRLINGKMVQEWLDARGLVWMPKGVDFKAKEKRT